MKRILISLLLVPFLTFSQTKDAIELCYAVQQNFNQFSSNSEASDALNRILFVTGATPNFVIMECDKISNAVAVTYKGERYILYDREFLSLISRNSSSWSNLFILAHEVGHHINGHTKDIALGSILSAQELEEQRTEELEADYYAGFVLAKLGATLSETNAAINLIGSLGDDRFSTHPDKNKRIEAITRGWNNGVERNVSQENTLLPSEEKLSGEWIQYRSGKENPFDIEEVYGYTIGRTYPVNANTANIKPKLIVDDNNRFYFDDIEIPNDLNLSYKIIDGGREEVSRYFLTEVSTGKRVEVNSKIELSQLISSKDYYNPEEETIKVPLTPIEKNQLEDLISNELDTNREEIYKSIIKQAIDDDFIDFNGTRREECFKREFGENIFFQIVWDDEDYDYEDLVAIPDNFFYRSNCNLYFGIDIPKKIRVRYIIIRNQEKFLNNLKSKNRLLIKPLPFGKYRGIHVIVRDNLKIELEITLERVLKDEIYFEFDLTGSSKALSFD